MTGFGAKEKDVSIYKQRGVGSAACCAWAQWQEAEALWPKGTAGLLWASANKLSCGMLCWSREHSQAAAHTLPKCWWSRAGLCLPARPLTVDGQQSREWHTASGTSLFLSSVLTDSSITEEYQGSLTGTETAEFAAYFCQPWQFAHAFLLRNPCRCPRQIIVLSCLLQDLWAWVFGEAEQVLVPLFLWTLSLGQGWCWPNYSLLYLWQQSYSQETSDHLSQGTAETFGPYLFLSDLWRNYCNNVLVSWNTDISWVLPEPHQEVPISDFIQNSS